VTVMTRRPSSAATRLLRAARAAATKAASSNPDRDRSHASDHPGWFWRT
jgi:hypothetical protein